ncbi:MAG: TolC family protein [candidate division KSB1 bacterium]|nr:TolC family protein [candidate division KSB1 bacterium]MDZ7367448.1 TolC family protein [candidate division KSB1 bacterium]MDZ7405447.1 TolC family protein [candidate division KSB1 bacterium]
MTGLAFLLLVASQVFARQADSTVAANGRLDYRPYSEAEIATVLQRPLTMEDCIRIALRKNIQLRMAEGNLARAEASHTGSYGKFLPVFSLEGGRVNTLLKEPQQFKRPNDLPDSLGGLVEARFDNQATIFGSAQLFLPTGATFQAVTDFLHDVRSPFGNPISKNDNRSYEFSLTQPLLRGFGPTVARSSLISTGYDRQIEEKLLLNSRLQTVFAIKRAYYDALLARELVKVNEAAVRSDSILIEASAALIEAKKASRRDVLSAQIRFADDRAALIASQTDYELALDNLKNVMGIAIDQPLTLEEKGLEYEPITLDEKQMVQLALQNNPSLQGTELGIKRSRIQLRVAKNELLPQLDLVAAYSSNLEKDVVLNQSMSHSSGWQANLKLSYSFLSRDAAAKAENAEIALRQQEDRLLDQQRQIMVNVRDIVRSVYTSTEEINAIKRSIEVAEDKYAFATTMFSLGRASNFDITDAQEFLLKARNQYLRKLVEYHTRLALLESLTGQAVTPAR